MSPSKMVKVRQSVRDLQKEYDKGNKTPLEDLVRAWKGIQDLPPTDKRSFFVIGGYHGEPFQTRPQVDALTPVDTYVYWGGYCNHGNVLFPTWHRIFVLKLEQALQTIVPDVAMPYWDETDEETLKEGIPSILTQEQFELDGKLIDNPLRSFTLPAAVVDDMNFPSEGDTEHIYEKPKGYQTVRYPLSGLVGTAEALAATVAHNAQFPDPSKNTELLNQNVKAWLRGARPTPDNPNPKESGVYLLFRNCLDAPNYTAFSNTTSAQQWNLDHSGGMVVSLEQPHNDIHLSVGGFDVVGQGESGQIAGANGDMGENNTAALDPIFFFHHCNVDRMFWLWQKKHCDNDGSFAIIANYAGTNSSDSQGPTPGIPPGTPLDLDTPLNPFVKDKFGTLYTSKDCFDVEKLGYTYAAGSLQNVEPLQKVKSSFSRKKLTVRGIDRALFQGSFVLRAYATITNEKGKPMEYYLGHHSVLSRRNVVRCANCLTHLEVVAHFPLSSIPAKDVDKAEFRVEIQHRGKSLPVKLKYTVEVID
jgi:tyrosinase